MPKYCSAPNCRNDSGHSSSHRRSFYKFPLQDPVRLQQWLKNMGRDGWSPSRHQYLCHEHFTPSCFTMRWGIRYLASDAVPTIFNLTENPEKRKSSCDTERKLKRIRGSNKKSLASAIASESQCQDVGASPLQLYAIAVDTTLPRQPLVLESSITEHSDSVHAAVPLPVVDGHDGTRNNFPVSLLQAVEDFSTAARGERAEVVMVTKGLITEKEEQTEEEDVEELMTAHVLTDAPGVLLNDNVCQAVADPSSLVVENMALEVVEPPPTQDTSGIQIIAYFETIPNVLPTGTTQLSLLPDTVLSSALSSKPIVSTLPIVSKHMPSPAGSVVLNLEKLESVKNKEEGDKEEHVENTDQLGKQLEEHRYHKNSLSTEQLEAIVVELQKKVKMLQQRHRRHLDKLLWLESTVNQLRHSNLLNEERLRLLERAYIQTNTAVSDASETVAIICEDENTAYLYTLPKHDGGEGLDQN
ncbi:THAP domain-containing protein 5-like [Scleropages formosus]|uniref:THAP domain-containing protein 5-like n=2 Tax=Scleropages formosus TaxID=113540 RepID=A0A8C9RPL8_SCLFO|nr:THAP domain-containing protein 5-like [Scleropages formosus]